MKTVDLARYAAALHQAATAAVVTEAHAATAEKPSAGKPAEASQAATPAAPPAAEPPALPSAAPGQPPITDGERAILLDLRHRREQLDARDAALTARESVLGAAENKLEAQAQALTALQKRLEDLQATRQQREEAGWQSLVKLYESMKPRDAATIFNDLDMPVLLPLVDRMKERQAGAILAAMNPDKARDVTAALEKLRTHREAAGAPAPAGG